MWQRLTSNDHDYDYEFEQASPARGKTIHNHPALYDDTYNSQHAKR